MDKVFKRGGYFSLLLALGFCSLCYLVPCQQEEAWEEAATETDYEFLGDESESYIERGVASRSKRSRRARRQKKYSKNKKRRARRQRKYSKNKKRRTRRQRRRSKRKKRRAGGRNAFSYRITSRPGPRWGRRHKGTDYGAPCGAPIRARASGRVTKASVGRGFGRTIAIETRPGCRAIYAHLSRYAARSGRVKAGQVIGYVGNSGRSTACHLHYESCSKLYGGRGGGSRSKKKRRRRKRRVSQ